MTDLSSTDYQPRFYDWNATFSRQTGTNGEFCMIVGGKGIGKTFGIRKKCVDEAIKTGKRFVEIFRTHSELKGAIGGYFEKLQQEGLYADKQFKITKNCGYIADATEDEESADWAQICYFCALTNFQAEKKRTYKNVGRVIYDEFIIDSRDRYHTYLPDEFVILANLLDTIFREQPTDKSTHKVYLLANACALTNPYFEALGIDRIPEYGYHWYNDNHVLFHYVEPYDAVLRQQKTFVGRMLSGTKESNMIFENKFHVGYKGDLQQKTSAAKYCYSLAYANQVLAVWIDYKSNRVFVNRKPPKNAKNIYKLTKKDGGVNRKAVLKADAVLQIIKDAYYIDALRFDTASTREICHAILDYLGVK